MYTLLYLKQIGTSPVVKNLACSAGDVSSIPGGGSKIPRASEQLTLHVTREDPA